MGRACGTHEREEKCGHGLVGKPEGKRSLVKLDCGWENKNKTDLK